MPAFPPLSWINVQFHFSTFENSNVLTTHHYSSGVLVVPDPSLADQAAEAIDNLFRPKFLACLSQDWAFDGTVVQFHENGQVFEGAKGGSEAGQVNSDSLPSFTAAVVQLWSDGVGKGARGRRYIPGVPEDQTDSSRLIRTAPWTALGSAYGSSVTVAAQTYTPTHFYKFDLAEQYATITQSAFTINLGTMRSRKRRYPI